MSWKDYQQNLGKSARKKRGLRTIISGVICFISVIGMYQWLSAIELPQISDLKRKQPFSVDQVRQQEIPFEAVALGSKQMKVFRDGDDYTFDLSIDPELQTFIDKKLRKYSLDWAGVAVMEPDTGRVLALSSYADKHPEDQKLPLRASFPAASIFKVVTAGALLEETTKSSASTFAYAGDMRKIHKRYLSSSSKGTSMTLSKAFAQSANGIFGVIGTQHLDEDLLSNYAKRFGFNERIPFEFPIEMSRLQRPESSSAYTTAQLAAGFGAVTLSPLHGAMIASSVIMDGQMMKPTIVDHIKKDQSVIFNMQPQVWKTPFSKENAADLRVMMKNTVTNGTARKSFRKQKLSRVVSRLEIGGKTGSLYGKSPKGRNEWFISYANDPQTGKKLAIGVVIVNEKYWKIKPAQLSQWIYKEYFQNQKSQSVIALKSQKGHSHGS